MAASATGLIHTDRMNAGHIYAGPRGFDIMVNDPPQTLVGFPYQARRRQHGHRPYQGHDQCLKQLGEIGTLPFPGNRHQMHPMLWTFRAADEAGEAASLGKSDLQIQSLLFDFEDHVINHPRRYQTQDQGV